jgi:hypothetical protein
MDTAIMIPDEVGRLEEPNEDPAVLDGYRLKFQKILLFDTEHILVAERETIVLVSQRGKWKFVSPMNGHNFWYNNNNRWKKSEDEKIYTYTNTFLDLR